ncbi:MAG TPA: ABC-type transport auxiliary lipoprotein family protein [Caulobacteraceae bacterium]
MSKIGSLVRVGAVALAAATLSVTLAACVSVFPKQSPANLFRFGMTSASPALAAATTTTGAERFGVLDTMTTFDRAAAGDRILTVSGSEAAYIKGSRWLAPANILFDEAVTRAFDGSGGPARLITHGQVVRADYVLKLDVRAFEARYDHGDKAAPTIVVTVHADLDRVSDRLSAGSRTFEASVPASDNRVGAIAAAFDQAVTKVLGDLVAWTDGKGQG